MREQALFFSQVPRAIRTTYDTTTMPNPRQTREEAMEEFLSLMEYIEIREAELAANQQRIAELEAALEDGEGTLILTQRKLAVLEEIKVEAEQKKAEAAAKVARGLQRLTQLQKERVALELAIAKAEAEQGENPDDGL
jgi:chromosome segregation ATPase